MLKKNQFFVEKCSFTTCSLKLPFKELIPCPHCQNAKYCSQKCLALDWEAWHKFSCPDSLSNNGGSVRSNLTTNSFHKSLDDYEPLDVEFLPGKDTKLPFEEKYKEDFQIVRDKKSHHSFLMKIIEKTKFQSETLKEQMVKSWQTHQKLLIHPHIIRLFHFFEDSENFYLIHEFLDRTLNTLFTKRKKLIEREAFLLFAQIALALDFLHKKSILHKRLNFSTTFLDSQGNIRLSDFGQMVDFSDQKTLAHLAPETLKDRLFTPQNDIWGLGLILYEMIHGHKAFRNGELKIFSFVSDECTDLITRILNPNLEERINLEGILTHAWMKKYEDVYKIKLKGYIHKESYEERATEGTIRTFIPTFKSRFSKRNSILFDNIKPDFLGSFYNRISFADEKGFDEEEKDQENDSPSFRKLQHKMSKQPREKKELESFIKKKKERAKKLAEKMTPNFSFVETREKVDENEKQSTNIDSVPNDLGVLSEREALKHEENPGFWDNVKSYLSFGCFCISKSKEKGQKHKI